MKRLNNKGFTLIELLSVIVILSIVVGISIPVSTAIISNSKQKSLGILLDDAEDFITEQWKIKKIDPETNTESFTQYTDTATTTDFTPALDGLIADMGMDKSDVKKVDVMIDEAGIACVVIREIPIDSKLYSITYWTPSEDNTYATPKQNNELFYSKCCSLENVLG